MSFAVNKKSTMSMMSALVLLFLCNQVMGLEKRFLKKFQTNIREERVQAYLIKIQLEDIHAKTAKSGQTALHLAASAGNVGMVKDLLAMGAEPNALNDLRETPAGAVDEDFMSRDEKNEIIAELKTYGGQISSENKNPLEWYKGHFTKWMKHNKASQVEKQLDILIEFLTKLGVKQMSDIKEIKFEDFTTGDSGNDFKSICKKFSVEKFFIDSEKSLKDFQDHVGKLPILTKEPTTAEQTATAAEPVTTNGQSSNGQSSDGQSSDGQSSDGQSSDGQSSNGQIIKWTNHQTDNHQMDNHQMDNNHQTDNHQMDNHQTDNHQNRLQQMDNHQTGLRSQKMKGQKTRSAPVVVVGVTYVVKPCSFSYCCCNSTKCCQ
jgi:hypothetical protein